MFIYTYNSINKFNTSKVHWSWFLKEKRRVLHMDDFWWTEKERLFDKRWRTTYTIRNKKRPYRLNTPILYIWPSFVQKDNLFYVQIITMHGKLFLLLVLLIIFKQVANQCLYPKWETTCQNYCLENKFYTIQLNQCWSKDPNNLRCKCNDQDFTEIIKALFTASKDEIQIP